MEDADETKENWTVYVNCRDREPVEVELRGDNFPAILKAFEAMKEAMGIK